MQRALLCLCLLSTALATPVPPPPLPGRAAGNCVGQHRKEEANSHSTSPGHQPGDDDARRGPTEDGAAPGRGDNGGTDVMENGTDLKTENRSTPAISGDARGSRPGTSTRARSGVGVAGATPASSEGSGDLDLVVEVDGDIAVLPPEQPSGAMAGNRSGDEDDGAPREVPVEEAAGSEMGWTDGRERAPTTGGAGEEGSAEATVPSRGQEGGVQGSGAGGTTLASVTEKMEDVQVDTKGVDEYAYIPDMGSVTITQGKVGSTAGDTSFTQISPDMDDEVNIFIGRANIRVGEQETTLASATDGSKDDSVPTAGTSSPTPRLAVTAARNGNDDDGIPARGQPEGSTTTATPSHGHSVTSSPSDSQTTGDNEDGATTVSDREEPVAPRPWSVTGGDVTIPAGAGGRGEDDKAAR
ncbi:PREDICTED: ovocleidin-116-like, partial [Pterocles gutturalis]|uniref:ovocleidin-116-like n=1 Tax=Pterocles gutturalis TaxID=240206 RepID=UPI000528CB20